MRKSKGRCPFPANGKEIPEIRITSLVKGATEKLDFLYFALTQDRRARRGILGGVLPS